jgi:hypothetical protein
MVADVVVMLLEVTALITGIVVRVEKTKFVDVAVPPESVDMTA